MLDAFQMMLEPPPDDPDVRAGNIMVGPSRWPDAAPAFRTAMEDLFRRDDGSHAPPPLGLRARARPARRFLFGPFPEAPDPIAALALSACYAIKPLSNLGFDEIGRSLRTT
jgi:hypothetical protein